MTNPFTENLTLSITYDESQGKFTGTCKQFTILKVEELGAYDIRVKYRCQLKLQEAIVDHLQAYIKTCLRELDSVEESILNASEMIDGYDRTHHLVLQSDVNQVIEQGEALLRRNHRLEEFIRRTNTSDYYRPNLKSQVEEILEARLKEISQFKGTYRFLSNFFRVQIWFEDMPFSSVEHAYQAAKSLNMDVRRMIQGCCTAGEAKREGREITLRSDWDDIKLSVMETLLREKFKNTYLAELLKSTGDSELIEGNMWNDEFWGVDLITRVGDNHLGKLLMKIRSELQNEFPK